MRILVVEDDADFIEELERILGEFPGPPEIEVAQSRESAFHSVDNGFFDLVLLDLKIPTVDGALDAEPSHGHAVFAEARHKAPGTPVFVLTGSSAEDFIPQLLAQQQQVDIWGTGEKFGTVGFLQKYKFEGFPEQLRPIVQAVDSLQDVELDRAGVELTIEDERLIRIFAKRFNGRRCVARIIGGGLSGALVARLNVTDRAGALVHDAVAKLGTISEVRDEAARFDNQVSRLHQEATPRKLAVLEYGARARAGVFYGLAEGFSATAFEVASSSDARMTDVIRGIKTATRRWIKDVPETGLRIGDIRRRFLSDSGAKAVLENFPIPWARDLESRQIQARWCCIHGDLHGGNVLVSNDSRCVLIDYGDVGDGAASLDPVSLELSALFHPQGSARGSGWPTYEQAKEWGDLKGYLVGCQIPVFVSECRGWAEEASAGKREIAASAYTYLLRQLKYEDTDKTLAMNLLEGVKAFYDGT